MSSLLEESNFPQFYDHHFLVKSNSIVLIVLFLHLFCCTHSVVLIDWLIFNLASCRLSGHFGQTATWNYILTFNLPHWNFHFSSSSSSFAWTTHSSARRSLLFILFCIIYPAWKQERHITPSSLVHAQNGPQWPQHFFFLLKKWFFSMWHINWREYVCRQTAPSIFTSFPFPFGHSVSKKEIQLALFGSCAHPLVNQCIQRGKQLWLARKGHMFTLGSKDVSMPDITIRPSRNQMVWRRSSSPKKVGSFGWKGE